MLALIRIILTTLWIFTCSLLGLIRTFFFPFDPVNNYWTGRLISWGARIITGIKLETINQERLYQHCPSLVVSNHQHNLDILPCGALAPKRTVSVGKKSLLWIPFFGIYYWLGGNILIKREDKKKARATIDQIKEEIKRRNLVVWIMPEGTRSHGKGLQKFKKGAFHVAKSAQVPLTMVVYSSYHKNINLNKWKSGTIMASILPPLKPEDFESKDIHKLADYCFAQMKSELERLDELLALRNLRN